jgi:PEGA domain
VRTTLPRLALALLLVLALVSTARAEESIGVLAVAEPPGPDARLVELTGQLRSAFATRTAGVLDAAALRDRMVGRAPPAALPELDRAYAGAIAAHAAGEYESSNRTLRSVVDALEALPEGPEVFAAWTRAQLRLARSEQELGRGVTAQAVLERLLRAAPELRADPRQFPPSFHGLVEEARARLRSLGTRRLTVESQPEARAFVEGREVGTTPVTLDLPPGRYRVAGLSGGIRAPVQLVELTEDRRVQLDLSLLDALRPDSGPGLSLPMVDRGPRLLAACSRLGLDRAVMASLLPAGEVTFLSATLLDARRGRAEREGRIVLGGGQASRGALEALAAYLVAGTPSPLVSTPEGSSLPVASLLPAGSSPLAAPVASRRGSPLGWAALGTGAAALVTGVLTAMNARDAQGRYADARAMVGGDGRVAPPATVAQYNAVIAAGDGARDRAVGYGVATGATLAATAVLSYLSYRQTGEVGPFRF